MHIGHGTSRKGVEIVCSAVLARKIYALQLHDLSVRELSVRMGGSRTGLLNASMVSAMHESRQIHLDIVHRVICEQREYFSLCEACSHYCIAWNVS